MIPIVGSLVTFIVTLAIGALAIYLAASFTVNADSYTQAIITALLGAFAWALTSWIPLVGPLIALVVWIGVINWRYPGGWTTAALIGVLAWLSALFILFIVDAALGLNLGAFGVPGA
ncbi:hypothetical protein ACLI4U_15705 [Natrialbaceae archaeon A-CW2]|uniref:hypothetical protein n=1 Tax=Natronosalvus amylolyticus TaxID=2961994 RepID=UPI0020C9B03D|nr:hypothetical protein [Natronosalvus amylolyticus]